MKITLDELCSWIIIIMSTLMLSLSGILGIEITKYCLYVIVALSVVKAVFVRWSSLQVALLGALTLLSFILTAFNGGSLSGLMVFLSSVLFAISIDKYGVEKRTWTLIKICTYVLCIGFILQMIITPSYTAYDQIVLYFDNPNMAGIALCGPAVMLVLMTIESKNKRVGLINLLLLAVMTYMVYSTQNRGSLIALLIVIAFAILTKYIKRLPRITSPWFFGLLKFTPIIVMFVYIGMYLVLPGDLEVFGKPLFSGRENSWITALEKIFTDPFAYHRFEEGTLNLFLEGAARYGTFSMLVYFCLFATFGRTKKALKEMSLISYVAYFAFHCCLLQQSFESTMLTGSYTVYIWSYLLLGVASMKAPQIEAADENKEASAKEVASV